jgi:uncharacterized membrane protein YqjE
MAETNLTAPPAPVAATPASGGQTVTELVTGIINDAQHLLRQQIEMLKSEFHEDLRRTKQATLLGGLGIVGLTVGAMSLVFFLVYLLHDKAGFEMWASWGIIGGLFLAAGIVLTLLARNLFESFNPLPDKTFSALQENLTWTTK